MKKGKGLIRLVVALVKRLAGRDRFKKVSLLTILFAEVLRHRRFRLVGLVHPFDCLSVTANKNRLAWTPKH